MRFPRLFFAVALCTSLMLFAADAQLLQGQAAVQNETADPIVQARERLAAAQSAHPVNRADVTNGLILLSLRLRISGKHADEAYEVAQQAVTAAEAVEGKESILYARALANLGKIYETMDHPEKGRPLAEQALEIAQKMAPGTHDLAEVADALGQLCLTLHDVPCALHADEEAVTAERASHYENELYLASMLQDLAELRRRTGDLEGTRAAMLESLTIVDRQPKATPAMAVLESNAGSYFLGVNQPEEAFAHLKKALEYSAAIYGEDSIQVARASEFLAAYYVGSGSIPEGRAQYEKALAICRKWYGPSHTMTARMEVSDADLLAAMGNHAEALGLALHAQQSQREYFSLAVRVLPERQALALERIIHPALNIALTLVNQDPTLDVRDVYQEEIRSRALVAEEMAQRRVSLNRNNDAEISLLLEELDKKRATLFAAREAKKQDEHLLLQIFDLNNQMEVIERKLAERSQAFRSDQRTRSVDLKNIRQEMPKDSVLVSYVSYVS